MRTSPHGAAATHAHIAPRSGSHTRMRTSPHGAAATHAHIAPRSGGHTRMRTLPVTMPGEKPANLVYSSKIQACSEWM